jgi:hypothetical protein
MLHVAIEHVQGGCWLMQHSVLVVFPDDFLSPRLLGHPQVLALDVLRAERAVSTGADRSCRVWKVPEESQLIFK